MLPPRHESCWTYTYTPISVDPLSNGDGHPVDLRRNIKKKNENENIPSHPIRMLVVGDPFVTRKTNNIRNDFYRDDDDDVVTTTSFVLPTTAIVFVLIRTFRFRDFRDYPSNPTRVR